MARKGDRKWATQSVIVKKSHPRARGRASAAHVARKFADRIYTSRETGTSWRFRQRPPDCFSSMKTVCPKPDVCLVTGRLKRGARSRRSCR